MIEATDTSFAQDVANGLVLVDFYAPWCAPCAQLIPTLEDLDKNFIKVVKVNIDDCGVIPASYKVRSVPTLMLFTDGIHISTKVGNQPLSTLLEWINANEHQRATEIEWLRFFFQNVDLGPAHGDVVEYLRRDFEEKVGKKVPIGYESEE